MAISHFSAPHAPRQPGTGPIAASNRGGGDLPTTGPPEGVETGLWPFKCRRSPGSKAGARHRRLPTREQPTTEWPALGPIDTRDQPPCLD
ncbi:hypothetical protein BP5796_11135 [Coleophoma crateriformis]|uniref:Uncharacterized protein n=1 Tax=Coleophoma crateriformis TaxID=565419 RepID=A0A3D8QLY0_9HELO|nr:hypothetical protein BP5796_11135 [Coleophoma crateriformis]